jgi:hyperosmotically inducible protein
MQTQPLKEYPMNTTSQSPHHPLLGSALALTCFLALGLTGCEQQGSAEKTTGTVDRTTENTAPRTSGSADRPAQKMQGAEQSPSGTQPSAPATTQSAGDYIDDSMITAKVKAAILDDPTLSASRIEVTTSKGVVKLTGAVDSEQSISRVRELVGSHQGVKSVQTDLSVAATPGTK